MRAKTVTALSAGLILGTALTVWRDRQPNSEVLKLPAPTPSQEKSKSESVSINSLNPSSGFSWAKLETNNYSAFVARLREIGCPENTLCDILVSDLLNNFAASDLSSSSLWSVLLSHFPNQTQARQTAEYASAILGKQITVVRERAEEPQTKTELKETESSSAVSQLEATFAARTAAVWRHSGTNPPSEAELAALVELQAERRAALQELLPGAEFDRYEARADGTLASTFVELEELSLTEDEALQLIQLRRTVEESRASSNASATELEGLDSTTTAQLRTLLGEERYARYERLQNPDYLRLKAFAQGEGLPLDRMAQLYERLNSADELQSPQAVAAQLRQEFGDPAGEMWLQLNERSHALAASKP